ARDTSRRIFSSSPTAHWRSEPAGAGGPLPPPPVARAPGTGPRPALARRGGREAFSPRPRSRSTPAAPAPAVRGRGRAGAGGEAGFGSGREAVSAGRQEGSPISPSAAAAWPRISSVSLRSADSRTGTADFSFQSDSTPTAASRRGSSDSFRARSARMGAP